MTGPMATTKRTDGGWRWSCTCGLEGEWDHRLEVWAEDWAYIHVKLDHGVIVGDDLPSVALADELMTAVMAG